MVAVAAVVVVVVVVVAVAVAVVGLCYVPVRPGRILTVVVAVVAAVVEHGASILKAYGCRCCGVSADRENDLPGMPPHSEVHGVRRVPGRSGQPATLLLRT